MVSRKLPIVLERVGTESPAGGDRHIAAPTRSDAVLSIIKCSTAQQHQKSVIPPEDQNAHLNVKPGKALRMSPGDNKPNECISAYIGGQYANAYRWRCSFSTKTSGVRPWSMRVGGESYRTKMYRAASQLNLSARRACGVLHSKDRTYMPQFRFHAQPSLKSILIILSSRHRISRARPDPQIYP